MNKYNIAIASDHAGYKLKCIITNYLKNCKISLKDHGTNNDIDPVDYPDYANKVVDSITEEESMSGILICSTGIGMSISANRRSSIKAALCMNTFMAQMARSHNDANVLILGSKMIESDTAIKIVDTFLHTSFDGGRHIIRLSKIT